MAAKRVLGYRENSTIMQNNKLLTSFVSKFDSDSKKCFELPSKKYDPVKQISYRNKMWQ